MEEDDLPIAAGCRQLLVEPPELLRVRVGAVESEEADVGLRAERVVELPCHVEQLVDPLLARVVVAQRRVELHAGIQQRLVGQLELLPEVLWPLRSVKGVSHCHDEVVLEPPVEYGHLLGSLILRLFAGAEVAQDRELQRSILIRQCYRRFGRGLRGRDHSGCGDDAAVPATSPGPNQEEQQHNGKRMAPAHNDLHSAYLGSTSSMKSAITCACTSSRISQSPMNRYSRSSVSFGIVCSTWGGTVVSGTVSG